MKTETAYLKIYEKLRRGIVNGTYPLGSKLPSKRTLAEGEGVSVITAEHAYTLLAEEGYVESRERSGYFAAYRETEVFPVASARPCPAPRNTAPGVTFPYSIYAKAVRRVLGAYGEAVLSPVPGQGSPVLREAIASYLARSRGMNVSPEQIVVGAGAEYLYSVCVMLFGRERTFAVEDPSYPKIEQVYRAAGIVPEKLPLGEDGIRSDALRESRAGVFHISPYRSFPTGVIASATKKREYLRLAARRGAVIIEDDFESEFTPHRKPVETLFSLSGGGKDVPVVYINTFSMTVSPALRVGYAVLPEDLAKRYRERLGFLSCPVPVLDQYVLAELISGGDFERHINRERRKKSKAQ